MLSGVKCVFRILNCLPISKDARLIAIFQENPDKPVPADCLHSEFCWTMDDGDGGDNRHFKVRKAP